VTLYRLPRAFMAPAPWFAESWLTTRQSRAKRGEATTIAGTRPSRLVPIGSGRSQSSDG
jgi:hypothetical protein